MLTLALLSACQKELGELCSDHDECKTGSCSVVSPGAKDVPICVSSGQCEDEVELGGVCLRPCSAGCADGTVCLPLLGGCLAACERDDQCTNAVCGPSRLCEPPPTDSG
jgi:hypothetical protein